MCDTPIVLQEHVETTAELHAELLEDQKEATAHQAHDSELQQHCSATLKALHLPIPDPPEIRALFVTTPGPLVVAGTRCAPGRQQLRPTPACQQRPPLAWSRRPAA